MTDDLIKADDLIHSINGFDEIALAKHFDMRVHEFQGVNKGDTRVLRALLFLHKRRTGAKDGDAWRAAMEVTVLELPTYFATTSPDEADDEGKAPSTTSPTPAPEPASYGESSPPNGTA